MQRVKTIEDRKQRIKEKIKSIEDLYNIAFETMDSNLINAKEFKIDLTFECSDVALIKAVKIIKKQISLLKNINDLYPTHKEIQNLIEKLFEVHNLIIVLLKEEFSNYRKKFEYLEI